MTRPSDNQEAVATFWRNNAGHSVSGLISTLARGYDDAMSMMGASELAALCEKAFELSVPIDDYEEAARQAGWTYEVSRMTGTPSLYHPEHGRILGETWQSICADNDIEPYQWEVYEHWIVDQWLAEKLQEKGQRVDLDFEGLCIWGRTCTGQAVSMDSVIKEIYDDLHKEPAKPDDALLWTSSKADMG